jgi:sialic acid synthase SpsE
MVFVIAEGGINHNGRLDHALALVAAAKNAGADAVKFQAFTPLRIAPLNYETQAMLKGLALTESELTILHAECRAKQIEFMCTPMDEEWLDFIVSLGVKRIKVGSGQNRDHKFLKAVAAKSLPVIISDGMADNREFCEAVEVLVDGAVPDITVLSCISKYPTPETSISLSELTRLRDLFGGLEIGFSSHCRSFWPSVAAAYAGATVIEQHLALPGTTGPDVPSSLLPEEFRVMVREVRAVGHS